MEINSIIPVIINLLYINFVFLIGYFFVCNKKKQYSKVDLKKISPVLSLYCYNKSNMKSLFWITLFDLIDNGYFDLETKKNVTYIKTIKEKASKEYENIVLKYIKRLIELDKDNKVSLSRLEYLVRTDISFDSVISKFSIFFKEYSLKINGVIDKKTPYIIPILFAIVYAMEFFYFVNSKFSIITLLFLAIPVVVIIFLIVYLIKDKISEISFKNYYLLMLISSLISVICYFIWGSLNESEYVIFHAVMAVLTFMLPMYVLVNIYYLNNYTSYTNENQKNIVMSLNQLKEELIQNNKKIKDNYIYAKLLKLKVESEDASYQTFTRIFKI